MGVEICTYCWCSRKPISTLSGKRGYILNLSERYKYINDKRCSLHALPVRLQGTILWLHALPARLHGTVQLDGRMGRSWVWAKISPILNGFLYLNQLLRGSPDSEKFIVSGRSDGQIVGFGQNRCNPEWIPVF